MTVYTVIWSTAGQDDHGNSKAFCGVHKMYTTLENAKKGLEECKEDFINELIYNLDFDEEEKEFAKENTHVYGSVEEQYFEIDYILGDIPCEAYIKIVADELI